MFKASLIISVYKNTTFLKSVLDGLAYQTEKNFEIIISEDGQSLEMKQFIESYPFRNQYQHLTQEDLGWRKNRALNRAIIAARAKHLIFIDGDCVPHPRFIEMHTKYYQEDAILAGLRVMLNEKETKLLLQDSTRILKLQPLIWKSLLVGNGIKRPEEGIYIPYLNRIRKLNYLTGCNMSFSKKAIISINGFDEDYTKPAYGEDTDLVWRFNMAGYVFRSLRNQAVQYHLFHQKSWTDQSENINKGLEKKSRGEFVCYHGLSSHMVNLS